MTKRFQRLFNLAVDHWRIPYPHLYVDGKPGDRTDAAVLMAKEWLGYSGRPAKRTTITPVLLAQLKSPLNRAWTTKSQRARGLAARDRARSNDIHVLAARVLAHRRITFAGWLSTGSDRQRFVELRDRGEAWCPSTHRWVKVSVPMVRAILAAADHTDVRINALTGGDHPWEDQGEDHWIHYGGFGTDFGLEIGDTVVIVDQCAKYGGVRNNETSHAHVTFPRP